MESKLIKLFLFWGFLLFIFSRFLFYLYSSLFFVFGFGINSYLFSAFLILLFSGFASYKGIISLNKTRNNINKIYSPIIMGFGIVFTSLLFEATLNFILFRILNFGYSLGILRLVACIIGGYIAAYRSPSPNITNDPKQTI